jgi:hypothetical protein
MCSEAVTPAAGNSMVNTKLDLYVVANERPPYPYFALEVRTYSDDQCTIELGDPGNTGVLLGISFVSGLETRDSLREKILPVTEDQCENFVSIEG